MGSRLAPDPVPGPKTRSLVPPSLDAPLGILDVSTLRLLLTSTHLTSLADDERLHNTSRPASSELTRAYGPDASDAIMPRRYPRRRMGFEGKGRRRLAPAMLEPMKLHLGRFRRRHQQPQLQSSDRTDQHTQSTDDEYSVSACSWRRSPILAKSKCSAKDLCRLDHIQHSIRQLSEEARNYQSPCGSEELGQEIKWIQTHFPVRRLANTKCSVALRCGLFVATLDTNIKRWSMRQGISQWRKVILKEKHREAMRVRAFGRLVKSVEHLARNHVVHCFFVWSRWAAACQELEHLAASVSLQTWFSACRHRRKYRVRCAEMAIARAIAVSNIRACVIQRNYRAHLTRLRRRKLLDSVRKIQRFFRSVKRQCDAYEERERLKKHEELLIRLQKEHQLQLLIERRRRALACKIAVQWKRYADWREQLAADYVADLVGDVEFFAAVMSIQSHIRGFQCRYRLKRKTKSARLIQEAWRRHQLRSRSRKDRVVLMLAREVAASCLQRTFPRNNEQRKYRIIMNKSSRPMFLRALHESDSFRIKYCIPIMKSAVSVIQSTWRRHTKHEKWKTTRDSAARRIQLWLRRALTLLRWQDLVQMTWNSVMERRRRVASSCLQRWIRRYQHRKATLTALQLVEMLRTVVTIQRHYRQKRDRWRRLAPLVLTDHLPKIRAAVAIVQRCWRRHEGKKRQLLAQFGVDRCRVVPSLTLHELHSFLLNQRREHDQREAAASIIQKAARQRLARRQGRLLMKQYRVLFHKELRRQAQRQVIHAYLAEKQDERTKRKKPELEVPSSRASSAASPSPTEAGAASATGGAASPIETRVLETPTESGDGSDVVKCWSEEHQYHYWYNPQTGESAWC